MSASRPRVLAILPAFIPSTIISVVKPLLQLHRAGHINTKITLEYLGPGQDLKWADLVVLCRNTEPLYHHVLEILQRQNIPFIYDLDDNFFELPFNSEIGRYHRSPERLAMLGDYLRGATLVRVYSEPLLEKAGTLNQRVMKVFGPIDQSLISFSQGRPNPETIKLVYATSRISDGLSAIFAAALTRVLTQYAGRVEAHFWGAMPSSLLSYRGVYQHSLIRNYDRFLRRFSRAGYDIGLAPLPEDVFHRSKSNNKFREYGACGISGIYSDVDVYSSCVTDGETGLLVPNEPEAWYKAMVRLIVDCHLREKIKRQAQDYVRDHYFQEKFEKLWMDQIQGVLAEKGTRSHSNHRGVSALETASHLWRKSRSFFRHLWSNGFYATFTLVQSHLFDLWMVLKLRSYTALLNLLNHAH